MDSSVRSENLQQQLGMCLEKLEVMRTELGESEPHGPPKDDNMNKIYNRKVGSRTSSEGVSVAHDVDGELLTYQCAANVLAPGGHTLKSLVLQAVLERCSNVTGRVCGRRPTASGHTVRGSQGLIMACRAPWVILCKARKCETCCILTTSVWGKAKSPAWLYSRGGLQACDSVNEGCL